MKNIFYGVMLLLGLSIAGCQTKELSAPTPTPPPLEVNFISVSLNPISLSLMEGETKDIVATVEFIDDLHYNHVVTTQQNDAVNVLFLKWSSSDESVAKVKDGKVTAVKAGTAKITVKTVDGGKTAECTIIVMEKKASVKKITYLYHGDFEGEKDTYTFLYSTDGRVSKITTAGTWENWEAGIEYSSGTVSVIVTSPSYDSTVNSEEYTYLLGTNGHVDKQIDTYGATYYSYDGTRLIQIDDGSIKSEYTWKDGDIVSEAHFDSNGNMNTYSFHYSDLDNPFAGSAVDVAKDMVCSYGALGLCNLFGESCFHLPDAIEYNSCEGEKHITNYEYSFSDGGELIKIIEYSGTEIDRTIILEY